MAESIEGAALKGVIQENNSNQRCVDCDCELDFSGGLDQPWASINLGIFMCAHCCGAHRSLGAHISKMRSVCYDTNVWDEEIMNVFRQIGNGSSNGKYEEYLPSFFITPRQCDGARIRNYYIPLKYREKLFQNPETIKHSMPQPVLFQIFSVQHPSLAKRWEGYMQLAGSTLNAFKKPSDPKPFHQLSIPSIAGRTVRVDDLGDEYMIEVGEITLYTKDIELLFAWTHALRKASMYYSQIRTSQQRRSIVGNTVDISKARRLGEAEKQPGSKSFLNYRWDKREWFVGKDNILYYVKPLGGTDFGDIPVQGGICLEDAEIMVAESKRVKKSNTLVICTPERNFLIGCSSPEQMQTWLKEIEAFIRKLNPRRTVLFTLDKTQIVPPTEEE